MSKTINIFMSFQNLNVCNSFTLSTNSVNIVQFPSFVCSEVLVHNHAPNGNHLIVYDKPGLPYIKLNGFCLDGGFNMVFRGITNSNQLSAVYEQGASTHEFSCRTQYFSQSIVKQ